MKCEPAHPEYENTSEMEMTMSQERALEWAIVRLVNDEVVRMGGKYRVTKCEIKQFYFNKISLLMQFDNGKPGTMGFLSPTIAHLFVGKRGGYTAYSYSGHKRIKGRKALTCSNKI